MNYLTLVLGILLGASLVINVIQFKLIREGAKLHAKAVGVIRNLLKEQRMLVYHLKWCHDHLGQIIEDGHFSDAWASVMQHKLDFIEKCMKDVTVGHREVDHGDGEGSHHQAQDGPHHHHQGAGN